METEKNNVDVFARILAGVTLVVTVVGISWQGCQTEDQFETAQQTTKDQFKSAEQNTDKRFKSAEQNAQKRFAAIENRIKAKLEVLNNYYWPLREGLPTYVNIFNRGSNDALITSVKMSVEKIIETPDRPPPALGAPRVIPIKFNVKTDKAIHDFGSYGLYDYPLLPPEDVPGNSHVILSITIDDVENVGKTYQTTLRIHYDNGKVLLVDRVDIDVINPRKVPSVPSLKR